jgi:hypothetical protein
MTCYVLASMKAYETKEMSLEAPGLQQILQQNLDTVVSWNGGTRTARWFIIFCNGKSENKMDDLGVPPF